MRSLIAGVLMMSGVAAAGPAKRFVDVTVTFKRTVTDNGSSTDATLPACKQSETTTQVLDEQVVFGATKVEITDSSDRIDLSLPMSKSATSGKGQYTFTVKSHQASCNATQDLSGTATSNAEAKDIQVIFYFDKKPQTGALTVSPNFASATGQGTMKVSTKGSPEMATDAGPMIAAQAGMLVASTGALSLDTAATLAQLDKGPKQVHEVLTQLAQGKPLVVSTPGGAIDLQYRDEETTDLGKLQPPPGTGRTSSLIRKVTTEVSIHATPSK